MEGVEIIDFDLVKADQRGSIFEFENRKSSKILVIKRKKGTISGAHFHTGKNPMKNPETLALLDGKAEIILKNVNTKEEYKQIYDRPILMKIDPYIYHEIIALTDIILLDMNSIGDDDDTIKGLPVN